MKSEPAQEQQSQEVERRTGAAMPFTGIISAFLALLIPVFTGAAYLTGVSYHREYLRTFSVPYGIINKSTTDYFLAAHRVILSTIVEWIGSSTGMIVLTSFVFLVSTIIFGIDRLGKWLDGHPKMRILRNKVKESGRLRLFGHMFGIPALLALFLVYLLIALAFLLVIPETIGKRGGRLDAESVRKAIEGGCTSKAKVDLLCTEVMHDGRSLARGFVLDASDKHVFLVEEGISKVLPISDNSFVTMPLSDPSTQK